MTKEFNYDVVVVGAGNAALCAALSAKEQGANVLVLEKGPKEKRGGNSFFTDGAIRFAYNDLDDIRVLMPELTDEEASNIKMPQYTIEDYYNDLMKVTGGKSDPELANQLVSNSYNTISWMKQQGVEFELNFANQSFKNNGVIQFWGGLPVKTKGIGMGLVKKLFTRAEEMNIDIWYESPAFKLISENNVICAVMVKQKNEDIIVKTNSVVLACGSFEANKDQRAENLGEQWKAAKVRGTEFNTGAGIRMALEVGAQKHGQWTGCHSIGTDFNVPSVGDFDKPGDIYKKHSYPLGIMLNKNGERFVDEGADFRNYTYAKYGAEVLKQPDHVAFQIFDNQVRQELREEYNLPEATSLVANTLDELAELLPVNKEKFLETVEQYNNAVQEGDYFPSIKDGKGTEGIIPPKSNWSLRIEESPFYAFPVTCGITFCFGGVHANKNGEVLNKEDQPIKGLYAAGEMIGGIFYDNYPGGSGLMSGAVFGKIAGDNAAKYSLKQLTINN
ncbi:FAD-dependent tricarballylate dehydrogenase TcuA [Bacillus sp. JJ1562]|uniref:FAD-dependent tricarballylate dehydrogenase TcuA n=1 Tax=Bacillus sp. JJ1562 TaxID=3122960 RepID=UPI0030030ACA